jgi:hypothetical protein
MITPNRSITVHFCKPVSTSDIATKPIHEVMNDVRQAIIDKQEECFSSKD